MSALLDPSDVAVDAMLNARVGLLTIGGVMQNRLETLGWDPPIAHQALRNLMRAALTAAYEAEKVEVERARAAQSGEVNNT